MTAVAVAGASSKSEPDLSRLPPAAAGPVDFARQIEPLFQGKCVSCHGPEKQKGGLRLDHPRPAFAGGDTGKVIEPGKSAESRLIHLVAGAEPEALMPPKGDPLTAEQIGVLRAWIDAGADWPDDGRAPEVRSDHWSLQPIRDTPEAGRTPDAIDSFIRAGLAARGLTLSPETDRATLIRRVTFDLTGLPPAPDEIDAFVGDSAPDAYTRLVDRLLASPHYGERWGRHWLDAARYTESHGFEYDKLRPNAWHYRDYVIASFNADKPYDRFMREQIAGDVMRPATSDSIVATSLLVCGPWDEAGSSQANITQRTITREDEMEDLLAVVGQTFLGLTVNCARCHAHKSDPISHEEYYRLKAVFDGIKHGERALAGTAEIEAHQAKRAALTKAATDAAARAEAIEAEGARLAVAANPAAAAVPGPSPLLSWNFTAAEGAAPAGTLHGGAVVANGRLILPHEGAYFESPPLQRPVREKTLEAWVSLDRLDQGGGGVISLEDTTGHFFDAIVFGERQPRRWTAGSEGFRRTADIDAPPEHELPGTLVHMAIAYRADQTIALYRNGRPLGKPYKTSAPLREFDAGDARILLGRRHSTGGRAWLTGEIARAAVYDRALTDEQVADSFEAGAHAMPLDVIVAHLTPAQRAAHAEARAAETQARKEFDDLGPAPEAPKSYAGTRFEPPPTRRFVRGDVTIPDEVVTPGAIGAIAALSPDFGLAADAPEAERRLKFAEWLADPRNPLPARVMANRLWHHHFGQGLVATPNDFGVVGAKPGHPELLDWLASRFIESGWSVKSLHRLIVHSAVYRQSSAFDERAAALDADNTLLWRHSPRRLEAEAVRDAMLAVSGQLNREPGGPSFRPFDALPFPANSYAIADKIGPEYDRRTVYRMNVNSGKDPLLDAFDCPDPSVKTPRRGVTTTPLQALGLMNGSFAQRQARHLADRAAATAAAPDDLPAAVRAAWRFAFGRLPAAEEEKRAVAAARDRGLASVCWALLNSTEFVYVR